MDGFQTLPTEAEFVQWLEEQVFKEQADVRDIVLEQFAYLNIDTYRKRFLLTFHAEHGMRSFLTVMNTNPSGGPSGVPWPGLEYEVRVRAESMAEASMEITVLDVAPETDLGLVRRTMERYGEVRKCERMTLPAAYRKVEVNKVKVELVRNKERLPNIIHAFGTSLSPDDFLTWKLQYQGCPRYCYLCGATSHEARQCPDRRVIREELGRVVSVVGEEQEVQGLEDLPRPKLSYAAVLKDPSFIDRQRQERDEVAREEEVRREKEEEERQELIRETQERQLRQRASEEMQRQREVQEQDATLVYGPESKEGEQGQTPAGSGKRKAGTPSPKPSSNQNTALKVARLGEENKEEDASGRETWISQVEQEEGESRRSSSSSHLGFNKTCQDGSL
jgi:hypothetical protein